MAVPALRLGTALFLVLHLLPCLSASSSSSSSSCEPACQFTVPIVNETNCRVYGGDSTPFYRANATCLQAYNVSETRLDLDELLVTCPHSDGTGADPVRLLAILRANDASSGGSSDGGQQHGNRSRAEADYVKSLFPAFFDYNNATGHYQLKTNVTDRLGQVVDCSQSVAICWEVINIYLSTNADGQQKLVEVCENLLDRFRRQSEREQGEVRAALCGRSGSEAAAAAAAACEPLASQVRSVAANATSCDDIATPARLSQIPAECHPGKGGTGQDDGAGTSGSYRIATSCITVLMVAVTVLLGQ